MPGPPSRHSFPSGSGEPSLRRLGVGNGSSDRPVRAQIVVAVVVALSLVAVPLYLVRHPSATKKTTTDAAQPSAQPSASAAPVASAEVHKPPERLRLGSPQRVRCGARPRGAQQGQLCDQLMVFEEALAKAIRENETCGPRVKEASSINYVLTIDFVKRKLHMFAGASGDLHGPQARRSATCVQRALPKPDWDTIRHQFRYYSIAILATYLPESALVSPTSPPKFD